MKPSSGLAINSYANICRELDQNYDKYAIYRLSSKSTDKRERSIDR
ncbi:MAG: hypothetical protein M3Z01_05190 [Thermoproteota archaeon]|nr:hypothetical protein [Thermoproteota archaeon]